MMNRPEALFPVHRGRSALALALVTSLLVPVSSPALVLPEGFELIDPFPTSTFDRPTEIAFLPDGRSLVAEQSGRVWTMLVDGTRHPTPFIDLQNEVLERVDLGLLAIAVDPDFPTSPWIYLAYTVDPDGDGNDDENDMFARLTRYRPLQGAPNLADPASREVLIGATWTTGIPAFSISHTIGSIRFGADGSLLLSAGDGAHPEAGVDPGGRDPGGIGPGLTDPEEDIGSFRSRSLNSLAGKVLRLDRNTGLGLPDNPYWDGDPASKRSRVWVYGLRNPFRFAVRPGTGSARASGDPHPGTLVISDVGWDEYEEINVASDGGLNFGWPCAEGFGAQALYSQVQNVETGNPNVICDADPSPEVPDPNTPPEIAYHHFDESLSSLPGWKGRASTGGAFYPGGAYPSFYDGRCFVIDYTGRWIRTLELDASDSVVAWQDFAWGFEAQPSGIFAHPGTGDFYLVHTSSSEIWQLSHDGVTDVPGDGAAPGRLAALRPNPSAGAVRIALEMPRAADVTLEVFDARGALVSRRKLGDVPAGASSVEWDAADVNGGPLAPGVYFFQLVSPWGREARKLVLEG